MGCRIRTIVDQNHEPKDGLFCNVIVRDPVQHNTWIYDSNGIYSEGTEGKAATVSVGTVTTGEAGSNASVVNVGTAGDAVLNFTIPRGEKGDTADTTTAINNIYPLKVDTAPKVGIGEEQTDPNTDTTSLAIGNEAKAGNFSSGKSSYSTAVGYSSDASGIQSTALGYSSRASGYYSTALGYNSQASGIQSTALGDRSVASGNYSTALGDNSFASNDYSTALGVGSKANGKHSIAIGSNSKATEENEFSVGNIDITRRITHVTDPTNDQDAATKKYVDDQYTTLETTVAGKADTSALANYATKTELSAKADHKIYDNVNVLGATKSTEAVGNNQLLLNNGAIIGGTAQEAGLVTRGICGVKTPNYDGACDKENLYVNFDGTSDYNSNRQLILQAGNSGTHYGYNLYQYAAARGDAVKGYVDNAISGKVNASSLSKVATSGKYSDLTGTPTVDAALSSSSTNAVQNKVIAGELNKKANSSTTLSGYGITDAYTKNEVDKKISDALSSLEDGDGRSY